MSDLQAGLLAIGIVVVAGVYLFNLLQERRYRRKSEEGFKQEHEDVLFSASPSAAGDGPRIEPQIGTAAPEKKTAGGGEEQNCVPHAAADERETQEFFGDAT